MNPVRLDRKNKKHKEKSHNDSEFNDWLNSNYVKMIDDWTSGHSENYWDGINFPYQKEYSSSSFFPLIKMMTITYVKTRLFSQKIFKGRKLTDEEFFEQVKGTFNTIKPELNINEEEFKKQLEFYYESGQRRLASALKGEYTIKQLEAKLYRNNIRQYQTEENLINFVLKSQKGLSLIEIEHFPFDIPNSVRENIMKADELKVFDNFYILYTDPDQEKKVEIVREKKDPIVFGVIHGSNKLYYIDDWLSDYCKLTYKDILNINQDTKLTE